MKNRVECENEREKEGEGEGGGGRERRQGREGGGKNRKPELVICMKARLINNFVVILLEFLFGKVSSSHFSPLLLCPNSPNSTTVPTPQQSTVHGLQSPRLDNTHHGRE